MSTRGVNTNWKLLAKIKLQRANKLNPIDLTEEELEHHEKLLYTSLIKKEQVFNNHIPKSVDDVKDHPTTLQKIITKFKKI